MAHEIYYTSAPEGIRQGERGFCTVAASPGIPRRLWDRLEALSGYRHHFDAGSRGGINPVCHAHWMLNVEGRDYHVLSRVGDAGLDYSQRTNALAHHLVLEAAELPSAGPAWLLLQSGVMVAAWDGRVGDITRSAPLPSGDIGPRKCTAWQNLSGDAGWAGAVAHCMATTPSKPICLLFTPEQQVLPLVEEVIALLPVRLRWQATFNTYFTSLPGGVSCQWRCCLAGTPAAGAALRTATNGLIIDLSQPGVMGRAPNTAWAEAARIGQTLPLPIAAGGVKRAKMASPKLAAAPVPYEPAPVAATEVQAATAAPSQPVAEAPAAAAKVESPPVAQQEDGAAPPQPEISWGSEMRKLRRRRLMAIYALACVAIAAGVWLQVWASRLSANRPLPPVTRKTLPPPTSPPQDTNVMLPPVPTPVAPAPDVPAPAVPVVVTPPAVPVAVTPVPRAAPAVITLDAPLPEIKPGGGLRDVTRTVALRAERFDDLAAVASLSLRLPGKDAALRVHVGDFDGVFTVTTDGTRSRPAAVLEWADGTANPVGATPIVTVTLDKARPQLEFSWRTSLLLRRPELAGLAYWVLQNSAVVVSDAGGERPQRIEFGPFITKETSLAEPQYDKGWPGELPLPEQLSLGQSVPAGWRGTSVADTAAGGGKAVSQLLRVEKALGDTNAFARFTIRFSAGGRVIESDLKQAIALASDGIAPAEAQIKQLDDEMQQLRDALQPGIKELEQRLADWKTGQARSTTRPQEGDPTPAQYRASIDIVSNALRERQAVLEQGLAPLAAKRLEAVTVRDACRAQLAAYYGLKELELVVELPQGLRICSLRLKRD